MDQEKKKRWKDKSLWSKFSDVLFIVLIGVMLFPQGRMAVGGFVNGIKAKINNPSRIADENLKSIANYDWKLKDKDDETVNLNDYRGKVLFVNLWATWCPPCVGEMPEIQSLFDHYANRKDMAFLMISNEGFDKIQPFMDRKKYSFPVFSSISNGPSEFESNSIPTTFLISKSGKIVIREGGAANWNGDKMRKVVDDLLQE